MAIDDPEYTVIKQLDGTYSVVKEVLGKEPVIYNVVMGDKCECDCPHWVGRIRWKGYECKHHELIREHGVDLDVEKEIRDALLDLQEMWTRRGL